MEHKEYKSINKSVRKKDSMQLLLGKPVYTDDVTPDDALIVKILRSPHANAIVESINTAAAKKVPGVVDIYTWEDVPKTRFAIAGQTYPEPSPYDRLIIDRHVRFAGDVVAIIAAETEKAALVSGTNSENGETYLVPEDVKAEINELRKSYVSAKPLVTVEQTDALAGSVTYEAGTPAGLDDFDDGETVPEESGIKFILKKFAIAWKGKLIPVSRILLGAAKASLMNYLNRWFVKNAVLSENQKIFATLKAGYNGGAPKAVAGWKALKKSINKDLDPSCKIDGVIITNQSGWACLDEEEDKDGRPVLKDNPSHVTEKMFQSLPVYVFPDSHLPNIDDTHFPVIYGSTKAGATFVEHQNLEFAISEHFLFNKNQNCLRVIEGFDVMSADTGAYIYGSFTATAKA